MENSYNSNFFCEPVSIGYQGSHSGEADNNSMQDGSKKNGRRRAMIRNLFIGVAIFAAGLTVGSGFFQNLRIQWMKQNGTMWIMEGYSIPWTAYTPDQLPDSVELSEYKMQFKDNTLYLKSKDKENESYFLEFDDIKCEPVYADNGEIDGWEWYVFLKDAERSQVQWEDGRNWTISQTSSAKF